MAYCKEARREAPGAKLWQLLIIYDYLALFGF
jgi:hypothetical protein